MPNGRMLIGTRKPARPANQQRLGQQGERHEQDVAGEHVGHESDGERERRHDDRRDELDGTDEGLQRRGDAGAATAGGRSTRDPAA